MNTVKRLAIALLVVGACMLTSAQSTYAWPWSTTVTVKAAGNYGGLTMWSTFACTDANVLIEGRTYPVSVSKSFWSNTCNVLFTNVPTNKSGQLYINARNSMTGVRYTTGWVSVYIGRPSVGTEANLGTFGMYQVR